ncbi:exodeoxyribonuclease VII small subunit [bacterium]|nr:exodeoxyribonuclease VII small subunit [bacterium]
MAKEKDEKTATTKGQDEKLSFETALKDLEVIVHQLESGEPGLDESLRLFEDGIRLSRFCNKKLKLAERKIEMLTKDEKGEKQPKSVDIDL